MQVSDEILRSSWRRALVIIRLVCTMYSWWDSTHSHRKGWGGYCCSFWWNLLMVVPESNIYLTQAEISGNQDIIASLYIHKYRYIDTHLLTCEIYCFPNLLTHVHFIHINHHLCARFLDQLYTTLTMFFTRSELLFHWLSGICCGVFCEKTTAELLERWLKHTPVVLTSIYI